MSSSAAVSATFVAVALFGLVAPAKARLVEEKIMVPVRAVTIQGKEVAQKIVVTLFYEDAAAKPYPVLVINHGRSAQREERTAPGRMRMAPISSWFAGMGFLVALPTRMGYHSSGGEDVEYSGACKSKNYPPVYAASAAQTLQALEVLRSRPDVARDRTVFLGQSFGGTTSITLAALNPPGVQAAINFAGGGGGNPKTMPQQPCAQPRLKALFSDYGKTARVPTLWVYSENDMYWGPKLPKEWFDAFRTAGGIGEFRQFPPLGDDGHRFFSRARETWQPRVLEFLRANGYPDLKPSR
jgi:dienelactone hydrolase